MKKLMVMLLVAALALSGMALADYRPVTASPTPAPWGRVYGVVSDATNPTVKIQGVKVMVEGQVVQTDAQGSYELSLMPGSYTLKFEKEGYINTSANINVTQGVNTRQDCSMSRALASNEYRVVLTWGSTPSDLDSHLRGANARGGTYHVYYSDKTPSDARNEAQLDVDDLSSYGPETTTFTMSNNGTYVFYVHDFSNGGDYNNRKLASSGAKVEVYCGEMRVAEYTVPSGTGVYWEVFRIENGNLRAINQITNNEPNR